MKLFLPNPIGVLFTVLLIGLAPSAPAASHITTPKEFFGFNIGDDYWLANYSQLTNYWNKLAKESDRLKVQSIGLTEEGRPQMVGIVTSPANQRRLARYQDTVRRLALAEGVNQAEARKLAADGKAVVWIDGGLHASEVLGAQQLIETLYQFVSGQDAETKRILDDVIILFVHANPDGMELCSNWYMRETNAERRSLNGLPRLYQKYIGHDNNRDFYAATQSETKNMNRLMYSVWYPQIVYNHHQAGPPGTVIFCPPFRDPFNYNVDPLVISGIDAVGAAMMQRFLVEDKPGATVRSGSRYSTWWNGGLRTTAYFHNMIGLLTEAIGNPTPMQIQFNASQQLPKADYLDPIAPQTWHFRQSIEYEVSANKAVLDYASRHREQLLYDAWLMGTNAIARGNRDSWTVTPKMIPPPPPVRTNAPGVSAEERGAGDAAAVGGGRGGRGRGGGAGGIARGGRGGGGTNEFNRLFRDPTKRDARGYIIPAGQPDFLTARKFVNTLIETGIMVHRATAEFTVAGKSYPAGSYVVKCAQAFRSHVLDMFEPQDHPDDFAVPGGPPTPPYDIAGWTLAYQMAVKFDRVVEGFDGPFVELKGLDPVPPAKITEAPGAVGYFLDAQANDAYRAVNRFLAAGEPVLRLQESDGKYPAGTFFITNRASTRPLLARNAVDLGTAFAGSTTAPASAPMLKRVRIGLWDRYGGSIQSGWTRWLLEKFEFPFQVVYVPELDRGKLHEKFDVLIFVDGAIPGRTGAAPAGPPPGTDSGGDQPPGERGAGPATNDTAQVQGRVDEFREMRGNITVSNTIPKLRAFLEDGGTILTIGSSTSLGYHLGLALTNQLAELDERGRERALPREKFYVPGSVLRMQVEPANPLTWGMASDVDVMSTTSSQTFRPLEGTETNGLQRVGWFADKKPLRSGWAWGQERLENGVGIAEARVGKGTLVLYGHEILFRAQPHGTFKLLFNGIVQAGVPAVNEIKVSGE